MIRKIVRVDWIDTCSQDEWTCAHEIDILPITCHSVGYLIKRTNKAITLSATMGDHGANCQYITIPKGCISKVTEQKDAQA